MNHETHHHGQRKSLYIGFIYASMVDYLINRCLMMGVKQTIL